MKVYLIFIYILFDGIGFAQGNLLPDHPSKELIETNCSACHSLKLVVSNRMDRQRWLKTIRWMQEKHNLWTFSKEDENKILDYLSTMLGPSEVGDWDGVGPRNVNPLP